MPPLDDLRIVSIEQYGAGPFGTMQLADLGARVIKVEDPGVGGDVSRYIPPYQVEGSSLFHESFNRGKESIVLDLKNPAGRRVLDRLVETSDAVVSNLRGDQVEKLRLRYGDLAPINPGVVCVSLTGFGANGPRAGVGGYDHTVQGIAGWMSLTGGPDEPPTKSGPSLVDYSAGYLVALGVLAGVWRSRRTGIGGDLELSLLEAALAQLTYIGTWVLSRGYEPERLPNSAHQTIVPFQTFETADGWIVVACPKQSLYERLCMAIGRPDLVTDPRFEDFDGRLIHRDMLTSSLAETFATAGSETWLATLQREGVPCGAVNDVSTALRDSQVLSLNAIVDYEHPTLGEVRTVGSPFRIDGFRQPHRVERAPFLGEHTERTLVELCGYESGDLADLAAAGAFGDRSPLRAARGPEEP
jgi:crotonobetainyl-CoA:carnitine CoA-transferase CaiB-like acyl-CoA transferase